MSRFRLLAQAYPRTVRLLWGAALLVGVADVVLLEQRRRLAAETAEWRGKMNATARERVDAALALEANREQVVIEMARRGARDDERLHLAVSIDSARLHLAQQGAVLRTSTIEIGRDAWLRTGPRDSLHIVAPRGTRTIERVIGDTAFAINGGTLVYARGSNDTSPVLTGSVRLEAAEFKVLAPNLRVGQRVYFY